MPAASLGHNIADVTLTIEVGLFNSLARFGEGCARQRLRLPAGSTVEDVMRHFGIPPAAVHLVLVNGRDITPRIGQPVRHTYVLDERDQLALSGPVPYSWGYGAPVV